MPVSLTRMRQLADEAHMAHMKDVVVGESSRRHANRREDFPRPGRHRGPARRWRGIRVARSCSANAASHPDSTLGSLDKHGPSTVVGALQQ